MADLAKFRDTAPFTVARGKQEGEVGETLKHTFSK